MKRRIAWLASAGLVYGSPHAFSVTDDLLAFPQVSNALPLISFPHADNSLRAL